MLLEIMIHVWVINNFVIGGLSVQNKIILLNIFYEKYNSLNKKSLIGILYGNSLSFPKKEVRINIILFLLIYFLMYYVIK